MVTTARFEIDRIGDYQHAIANSYYPMRLKQMDQRRPFVCHVSSCQMGDINLTKAYSSAPYRASYSPEGRPCVPDRLVLMLHIEGDAISFRHSRSFDARPGTLVLLDSSECLETEQQGECTALSIAVPAGQFGSQLPIVRSALLSPVDGNHGAASLLRDFLTGLWREQAYLEVADAPQLLSTLIRLVGLAFRNIAPAPAFTSQAVAKHYGRVKRLIESELSNPDLSLAVIAQRLGISVSYLNVILRQAGTSYRQLVGDGRLERCRAMLADPVHAHSSITAIAFDSGFQDLSHFSRRFSQRFGTSPRAFRAEALKRYHCN